MTTPTSSQAPQGPKPWNDGHPATTTDIDGRTVAHLDADTLATALSQVIAPSIVVGHTDTGWHVWFPGHHTDTPLAATGPTLHDACATLTQTIRTYTATQRAHGHHEPATLLFWELATDDQLTTWLVDLATAWKAVDDLLATSTSHADHLACSCDEPAAPRSRTDRPLLRLVTPDDTPS